MEKVELMSCDVDGPLKINKEALFNIFQRDEPVPSYEVFVEFEFAETDEKGNCLMKDGKVMVKTITENDHVVSRFKISVRKPDS